jgi:hypothetical protein
VKRVDTPLHVEVRNGVLTIEIGVDALAFAALRAPFAWDMAGHGVDDPNPHDRFAIVDAGGFAVDVIRALTAEEDGSTLLTDLLDAACKDAVEDGAEHFVDRLETKP